MGNWVNGQPKHPRRTMVAGIKAEGVHEHAQRTLDRVKAQIAKRIAELRIEVALNEPLDDDMLRAMREDEVNRARRAWGIKVPDVS